MVIKTFKPRCLELSMLAILGSIACSAHAENAASVNPATVEACVALTSDAERLACYDTLYKAPTIIPAQVQAAEPIIAATTAAQKTDKTEPETLTDKVVQKVSDLQILSAAPKFDPNVSLLDRRWELSEESKLGVWNIRAYQPVYLLPAFWTSEKNEFPKSPNENN
ncbi:MAG TPA: phospholipase A, partial [Acinetobacter sp.]|nr:phospholipase A [Acinetobacter sp.]